MLKVRSLGLVIPYLEPSGNYNVFPVYVDFGKVIPYLEPSGNYNKRLWDKVFRIGYTIPRTIRELQPHFRVSHVALCYTIPRTIRELQRQTRATTQPKSYTIPRTIRELQLWLMSIFSPPALYHT